MNQLGDIWNLLTFGLVVFVVALSVRLLYRGTATSKATLHVFTFLWAVMPFNVIMSVSDNILVAAIFGALGALAGYVLLPQYVRVVPVDG